MNPYPAPQFTLPLLEWINIPAGRVTLEKGWVEDSDNSHYIRYDTSVIGSFEVAPFAIAKYPVTNQQYQVFIDGRGYRDNRWWQGLTQRIEGPVKPSWLEPTHPRESVSWYEAMAFTRWLAHKTRLPVTLPTEVQWQWAAVGDTGWVYPYGPAFDRNLCTTVESKIMKTTPVNFYDGKMQHKTKFGVMDLCGNVWEWCLNPHDEPDSGRLHSDDIRSMRGGSWGSDQDDVRATCRYAVGSVTRSNVSGFRVACAVYSPSFSL